MQSTPDVACVTLEIRGMTMKTHEPLPQWLRDISATDPFPRQQFFATPMLFYPGSGADGSPIAFFNQRHEIHCAVYADYGIPLSELKAMLEDPVNRFRGYEMIVQQKLQERDWVPTGWQPREDIRARSNTSRHLQGALEPFGYFVVFQRQADFGPEHGAERFALLFLGADGIATYDALWCQAERPDPPQIVVIQDHGSGMNYDRFGNRGLLHKIASEARALPRHLFVAGNSKPWDGYVVNDPEISSRGGMHGHLRVLWTRAEC
jgi:hypothetical protein